MIGRTLGHYEILGSLGKGGMGEVYRARDSKLGREVALKLLPAELATDPQRRARFEREARAVAALNHPHVVTIHSVEEAEGQPFLTMELVEGTTLEALIPGEGLHLTRLLELAIPLCQAVAAAHARGITHRDLKPANVMLDGEGRLKVLDFGLARLAAEEATDDDATMMAAEPITREGRILGTAHYMSPEQAEGRPVDARSDIFSLGVLLYEMSTGRRPFFGDTQISTISAILRDDPAPIFELRPGLPRHLSRVVKRCLEKDPARRYADAGALALELESLREESQSGERPAASPGQPVPAAAGQRRPRAIVAGVALVAIVAAAWFLGRGDDGGGTPGAPAGGTPTLIVFPFENRGEAADSWFASGLAEDISSRLARVEGLAVKSSATAREYDRSGKTTAQVGEELGVQFILSGAVRWQRGSGDDGRVQISPRLVRTHDDVEVWGERYDRGMADIFELQGEVARAVSGELGLALLGHEQQELAERPTSNLEAWQGYLRARQLIDTSDYTERAWRTAIELLERAVELDPTFDEAWAKLAESEAGLVHFGYGERAVHEPRARAAVQRALELEPNSAQAHVAMGTVEYWTARNYEAAQDALEQALEIDGPDAETLALSAYISRRQLRLKDAEDKLRRAIALEPTQIRLAYGLGETHGLQQEWAECQRWMARSIELDPGASSSYYVAGLMLFLEGRHAAALEMLQRVPGEEDAATQYMRSTLRMHSGDLAGARELANRLPELANWQYFAISRAGQLGLIDWLEGDRASARLRFAEAEQLLGAAVAADPAHANNRALWSRSLAAIGQGAEARRQLDVALETFPSNRDLWLRQHRHFDQVVLGLLLEDHDLAFAGLERLAEAPMDVISDNMLRTSPLFAPLRPDPRYGPLLARMP